MAREAVAAAASGMEKAKLPLGVLAFHCCIAGFHVVSRMALDTGVSEVVFMVYRNAAALALVAPYAYFLEKRDRPPLTLSLLTQLFILAAFGGGPKEDPSFQGYRHPGVLPCRFVLLVSNLRFCHPKYCPGCHLCIGCCSKTNINKRCGIAKVAGTVVSIGGATVITLYKGKPPMTHDEPAHGFEDIITASSKPIMNWTLGCLFLLGNCLAWSGWMVLQVPMLKRYPARLSMLAICLVFGLVQLLAIAAFCETNIQRWKMHSGAELFTILYAGLVASGLALSLQIWCIDRGGPLFIAVFQPAQTIIVAILAAIVLGDQLYTGGIIGGVIIVIGLYLVLWGKSEEKKLEGYRQTEPSLSRHLLGQESSREVKFTTNNVP